MVSKRLQSVDTNVEAVSALPGGGDGMATLMADVHAAVTNTTLDCAEKYQLFNTDFFKDACSLK